MHFFFCSENYQSFQDLEGIRTGPRIKIFFHFNSMVEMVPSCTTAREQPPQWGWGDTYPLTDSLSKELPGLTYLFAMFAIKGSATFFQKESYSSGSGVRRGDDSQLYLGAVVFTVSSASNISSLGLEGATSSSHMKRLHLPRFVFCLPNPGLLMGAESN